jgi:hypothetical protein
LGELINSFYQLINSTLNINPNEPLQKLSYISPTGGTDSTHLRSQSINSFFGKENLSISDIKKYPLYETDRGFMIIDEDMYRKKLYRGPLFELRTETELRKNISFEDYKTRISKDVYEKKFFQSIANSLRTSKYEIIKFDDNQQGVPDLYLRSNKKVLLIEFKDYLFPDAIVDGEDFNLMKNYIDERFISSNTEQEKGISQLVSHLEKLGQYEFDPGLKELLKNRKRVKVYPVICYTDFMFSVSGINEYLETMFGRMIKGNDFGSCIINQVTLISLEILFDFSLRGGDYLKLMDLINRYWSIIENRVAAYKKQGSMQTLLSSKVSFDEIYESIFKKKLLQNPIKNQIDKSDIISSGSGITQEILDEIL